MFSVKAIHTDKRQGMLYHLKKDRSLYIMLLPVIAGFFIFQYIPIINSFLIGFVKYDITKNMLESKWVGFQNFYYFFKDPYFFRLLRNTLLIGLYKLLWGFPAPIILALLLNELSGRYFKRIVQSITYLPHFISMVVIVGILYSVFGYDGIINNLFNSLGIENVRFVDNTAWFRTLYVGSGIWHSIGWSSIVYMAAIAGINNELYEAAVVDGAGRWRQMINITLPGIAPAVTILLIMNVGNIIDVGFEKVFLMYSPLTYEVSDILKTYAYRRGIIGADFGYAGAVDLFNSVISLILVSIANYTSRKVSETSLF